MNGPQRDALAPPHPDTERADSLERELQLVYASTSWKITAPVRWAGYIVHVARRRLRGLPAQPRLAGRRAQAASAAAPAYSHPAPVVNRRNIIGPRFETLLNQAAAPHPLVERPPST